MTTIKLFTSISEIRKFRLDEKISSITELEAKVAQFLTTIGLETEKPSVTTTLAFLTANGDWQRLQSDDQLLQLLKVSNSKISLKVVPKAPKAEPKAESSNSNNSNIKAEEEEADSAANGVEPEVVFVQARHHPGRRCLRGRRRRGCGRFVRFLLFVVFAVLACKAFGRGAKPRVKPVDRHHHHHAFFEIPMNHVKQEFIELISLKNEGKLTPQKAVLLDREQRFYENSVQNYYRAQDDYRQNALQYQQALETCHAAADESLQHQFAKMDAVVRQKHKTIAELSQENKALKNQVAQLNQERNNNNDNSPDLQHLLREFSGLVQRNAGDVVQTLLESDVFESVKSKIERALNEIEQLKESASSRKRSTKNHRSNDDDDDDSSSYRKKNKSKGHNGQKQKKHRRSSHDFLREIFRHF